MKKLHESAVVFSFRGESMSHNAQHFQYSVELIKMNEYFRVYLMPKHGPHSHLLSCECLCVCVVIFCHTFANTVCKLCFCALLPQSKLTFVRPQSKSDQCAKFIELQLQ